MADIQAGTPDDAEFGSDPNWFSRRGFLVGAAGVASLAVWRPFTASAQTSNLIQIENQRTGTDRWRLTKLASDRLTEVSAFTRTSSVRAGDTLEVCVLVPEQATVSAEVFRIGYYNGLGGRLMKTIAGTAVAPSPSLEPNPTTGEVASTAPVTFRIPVGNDWISGVYLVKVKDQNGFDAWAQFIVIDDRPADVLFQHALTTMAAYCATPQGTGKALYDHLSSPSIVTSTGAERASVVSLDRPLHKQGAAQFFGGGDSDMLVWLEREGYDVTYKSVIEVHRDPAALRRHKVLVSAGHDEYWTQEVYDGWRNARDAGVSLFVSSANCAYWRIRLEPSADGRPHRRIVCYKEAFDPGAPKTERFRNVAKSEQELIGVNWNTWSPKNTQLVPTDVNHWFWNGTGVSAGVALPPLIVGYEIDSVDPKYPLPASTERTILAASPFTGSTGSAEIAHTSLFRAPSGAWVFASGTISWAWALARGGYIHPAIQRATSNLFNRMLADGGGPVVPPIVTTTAVATTVPVVTTTTNRPTTTTTQPTTTKPADTQPPDTQSTTTEPEPLGPETEPEAQPVEPQPFAPFATAAAFVRQQYRDFLGREADQPGLEFWANQLGADGSGRELVIERFLSSDEFDPRLRIARLYLAAFARVPDSGGYDYWADQHLRIGLPVKAMGEIFADSPEFHLRYGTPDSSEFVRLIYRNVFGRDPDQLGHDYWVAQMGSGLSRGGLLAGFSESPEGRNLYEARVDVIVIHEGMLERPPTQFEYEMGRRQPGGQASRSALIRATLASTEYAARVTKA